MTAVTNNHESKRADAWVARFDRLLQRQIDLCRSLAALADRQRDCIDKEQPEILLGVLAERQSLIDQIRGIAEEAAPLRKRWAEGAGPDGTHTRSVHERIGELTELMLSISERDAEDRRRLGHSRDELAGRLAGVARSRGAITAYGRPPEGGPRFQDREC